MMTRLMVSLQSYGLDGQGQWREGNAALGHQMLYGTPESLQARIPWQDSGSGWVITADARLDNRLELYGALDIPALVGRDLSAPQLILKAYQKWGENCPQYLLGDFAFAIWDAQRQQLFCARDIMGVRPFFYHISPQRFIFASDIKGVLAIPDIEKRFYEPLLAAMLQGHDLTYGEKSVSFYDGILKLPPAHSLVLTPTRLETHCYWSPETAPEIRLKSEADYVEALQALLEESVNCRLRSAFPVGAHLSGGLDSSAISILAARRLKAENQQRLTTFSWAPAPDASIDSDDEYRLIQEVCGRESINCHYINQTVEDVLNIYTQDFTVQPTTMLFLERHVQAAANQQNIRLLLSGWGGDEGITFNGRGYFAELFLQGRWQTLWQEGKLRRELHGGTVRQWLKTKVFEVLLPDVLFDALRVWRKDPHYGATDKSLYIQPEFAHRSQVAMQPLLRRTLRERPGVRQQQWDLLTHGHLTKRIEDWAISGGQRGLVYSYPLLDRRILEFALGIPRDLFFKHGWKRYLFRTAMENILPDAVRWNKTKDEPALWARQRELSHAMRSQNKQNLQAYITAGLKMPQLEKYVDVKRLAMAQADPQLRQTGFGPAQRLALLMGIQALAKPAVEESFSSEQQAKGQPEQTLGSS